MQKVNVSFDGITYSLTNLDGSYETECVDYESLEQYLNDNNLCINGSIIDQEED